MNRVQTLKRFQLFQDYVKKLLKSKTLVEYVPDVSGIQSATKLYNNTVRVAVNPDILDVSVDVIDEYDFVEGCIATAHELHHAAILSQSRAVGDDIVPLSESYISRFDNNTTYKYAYGKFSYEIAAEGYALKTTYNYLINAFPKLDTDDIMLDYVNVKATQMSSDYPYPIRTVKRFENMNQVFDAFDTAYEKSFKVKKNFAVKGNHINDIFISDVSLKCGFDQAKDGREQTKFAAIIALRDDPDLFKIFNKLNRKDYDVKQIYDARNRNRIAELDRHFGEIKYRGLNNPDEEDEL